MMFGVYTDRGDLTCAGRPAAQGFEKVDAETYANNWQVDYLKEDSCNVLLKKDHAHAFAQCVATRAHPPTTTHAVAAAAGELSELKGGGIEGGGS